MDPSADLVAISEETATNLALVLYFSDVQVEVSPQEIRFREPVKATCDGSCGTEHALGDDPDPSLITSFSRDAFDAIATAHQAMPRA